MRLFGKKRVPLEEQLATLAELGLTVADGVSEPDLTTLHDRPALEAEPYSLLIQALGMDVQREPFPPLCERVWLCDFERIEDHGDYRDVVLRLDAQTGRGLGLAGVTDHVDVEEGEAWVELDLGGRSVRWEMEVDDDWLDPDVLSRFGALLEEAGAPLRLFLVRHDLGQSSLFVGLAPEHVERLSRLCRTRLERL